MTSADVLAQSTESNVRWTGTEINTTQLPTGTEFFLYNVGTGRFLIHGGDWGTQARLFYEDTGKLLQIRWNSTRLLFDTNMTTQGAKVLGCNVPGVTTSWNWTTPNNSNETFGVLLDANEAYANAESNPTIKGDRQWKFIQVEDESGVYTYYLYETLNNTNYYLGSSYGENEGNFDGDPNGKLALLSSSYDKAVWSTADPQDSTTNYTCELKNSEKVGELADKTSTERNMQMEVPLFNTNTKVKLNKLYQWRIVTKAQLFAAIADQSAQSENLNINLTYLIQDRGFERNDYNFFNATNGWNIGTFTDQNYTTSNEGRYSYTHGIYDATGNNTDGYTVVRNNGTEDVNGQNATTATKYNSNQDYRYPLRLKEQFPYKADAKNGYMSFEGIGTVSTYIQAPRAGTYKISAYGFYQQESGSADHPAYLFATTISDPKENALTKAAFNSVINGTANDKLVVSEAFPKISSDITYLGVSSFDKSTWGDWPQERNDFKTQTGTVGAGYEFVNRNQKVTYRRELEITLEENQIVYFGVVKLDASKSSNYYTPSNGSRRYYYDTDWVGADQFEISYMGEEKPIMFDEDENNRAYIQKVAGSDNDYTNQGIYLHRTFEKGQWNSFVFPLNISSNQVRKAFGDGALLAELHGLGTISGNKGIIDFKSVTLGNEMAGVTAGKFYIVKPEADPLVNSEGKTYYDLGRATFNTAILDNNAIEPIKVWDRDETVSILSHATYFNNTTVDAGAYVMGKRKSDGKFNMFYLKSGTTIKGFRGWITDEDEVLSKRSMPISFDGVYDETDNINELIFGSTPSIGDNIYDVSGRKVGAVEDNVNLPKGLYIVNGKKFIVK